MSIFIIDCRFGGIKVKFYILDKVLEFKNDDRELDSIFKEINQMISDSNCILSYLDIDGNQVYEDYYGYFLDHIDEIKEVKVITKTAVEIAKDTLVSTADYLSRAIPEVEKLANEFYKTPKQESWNRLAQLLEGIEWIVTTFSTIDEGYDIQKIVKSYETWNLYAKDVYSLKDLMDEFEEVLNSQDYISIADILSYEISPLFKEMLNKLIFLVYKEEDFNVIN